MTDSAGEAKRYALKLLSYRGRSESELRQRLDKKGFPEDITALTLKRLKQSGYLDDKALALNLKRQALEKKLLGYEGVRAYLMKKGISMEVIEATVAYDETLELRNAQGLAAKRLRSAGDYLSLGERRRLWNFLSGRGYSYGVIKKVLNNLHLNEEAEG